MKSKTKNWTKLTLSIDDDVTAAAKALASLERRSVSSLFETFVIEKYKETFNLRFFAISSILSMISASSTYETRTRPSLVFLSDPSWCWHNVEPLSGCIGVAHGCVVLGGDVHGVPALGRDVVNGTLCVDGIRNK